MRLTRPVWTIGNRVESIRLRITARDVPDDAHVNVTDVQLTPGSRAVGPVPNPEEAGTRVAPRERTQWRNGVVHPGQEVLLLANPDRATPTRVQVRNAAGDTRIASYRFGAPPGGTAEVDGRAHTSTHGYGLPPTITERSDFTIRTVEADDRVHLRVGWESREP